MLQGIGLRYREQRSNVSTDFNYSVINVGQKSRLHLFIRTMLTTLNMFEKYYSDMSTNNTVCNDAIKLLLLWAHIILL